MIIKTDSIILKHLIIFSLLITGCFGIQATDVSTTSPPPTNHPLGWTPRVGTPIKNLTMSLTPLPTVPHNEIHQTFETLLATNRNCRLPCFWGMTPGKSTVEELIQFSNQFTKPSAVDLVFDNGTYILRYLDSAEISYWVVQFFTEGYKITSIAILAETAQFSFPLGKLLTEYGKPENVLIGPKGFDALPMIVLYENQHFIADYYLYQDGSDKSIYCYNSHGSSQEIITWSSEVNRRDHLDKKKLSSFKPLDEVSNYDIQSFYENLKQDSASLCMRIHLDKILP